MAKSKNNFYDSIFEKLGEEVLISNEKQDGEIEVISTGCLSLDVSTGIGGIPRGKITEIYGPDGCGKTTLAIEICRQDIMAGGKALFIDVENMLNLTYAHHLLKGEDKDNFIVTQPDTAEDAFLIAEAGVNSGEFDIIVFDSVGALAPEVEKKKEFDESTYAAVAKDITKFLKRNAYKIRTGNIAFVFLNQVRAMIGSYIKDYERPGGYALRHFTSLRIFMSSGKIVKQGDEKIGIISKFTVKKNKMAPPFRSFYIPIVFGEGIDNLQDLVEFSTMLGVLKRAGAYYKYNDETLGIGVLKTINFLKENPKTLDKIKEDCYNLVNESKVKIISEESETDEEDYE